METNANNTGWVVSGVLAVIIVILLAMMWQQWDEDQKKLGTVLENGRQSLAEVRIEIAEKCNGPSGTEANECKDALKELDEILTDFKKKINIATTSAQIEAQQNTKP